MRLYKRGFILILACVTVAVLALCLFPSGIVHAAAGVGEGIVSGRLLDGTKHNAPVVGQSVTLQVAQNDTARDLTSVKTDARGGFTFGHLDTSKTLSYAVYIRYQGAQYYTDLLDLSSKPTQQVTLTVYEATTSAAKVLVTQATLLVHDPNPQTGIISISEVFFFENLGTTTYVGSLDASKGKPNALRFTLPAGAKNVSLSQGFDGSRAIQVNPGFATDAAIPPGNTQFAFSFEMPYTATTFDLPYNVVYPTVQLSVLIPPTLHATGSGLSSQGIINANQQSYLLLQGKNLLTGNAVSAHLEGLPAPVSHANASTLNLNWLWLIVGLLAMLAIVVVTSFLYRVTHREKDGKHPAKKAPSVHRTSQGSRESKNAAVAAKTARSTSSSAEQKLLQELLDLDKSYEAGKLKKADYEERREKIKARLRVVMGEDASAAPRPTGERAARKSATTSVAPKVEESRAAQAKVGTPAKVSTESRRKADVAAGAKSKQSGSKSKEPADSSEYEKLLHPFGPGKDQAEKPGSQ